MKLILIVIALLALCILWAVIENWLLNRKHKKRFEKEHPNIHSSQELLYYKGIKKKHKFEKFCDN